jgi:GT2 family glycosyltransferase
VPAAVRLLDLELPLPDLRLSRARLGGSYRSLLAVARLGGDPLGAVSVPVYPGGRVSRGRLALWVRRQLEGELPEAFVGRGFDPPRSPPSTGVPETGVPDIGGRGRDTSMARRAVSVVVTTCSNPVALERCLRSILACDYPEFEVIVVENRPGSWDTAWMLAEQFPDEPRLRYLEERQPGLSRARNRGLSRAKGDIVAFTDDDVMVDPDWIRRCAEAFERADDVACVTGLILPLELETESQLLLERFAGLGKGFRRRIYRSGDGQDDNPLLRYTPGAIGSGANTALRADVASRLGGFDVSLGAGTPAAGGEELDLYIRLLRAGHAVAYEPGAIVWHEHPDGRPRLRRQVYRYGVGLGAMLAKQLVAGPERRELLRAVPAGVRYLRDPTSRKNARKTDEYPRHLEWLERLGMLTGPPAYVASALVTATRPRSPLDARPEAARAASRDGGMARRAQRALVATAGAACVVAPLFVALGLPPALRFPAVLALLCLAPGTALLTVLRGRLEPGLALGASLAGSAVLAQSMLWLGAWWPTACTYVLGAVCGPPLLARLHRATRWRLPPGSTLELRRLRHALGRIPRSAVAHGAILSAALVAWAASLVGADLSRIDGYGLLSALPPTYFLGFALLLIGFIAAVTREQVSSKLLGAYVLALIVVLHGTTPLLYDEPRYQWVYNHLAVIDLIEDGGAVDRQVDIYNNWPGFFAVNAWLSGVTGLSPAAYAPWAQVFFNLASVAALQFALRGVTSNVRLLWTATWLFVLGNWVGQDYLAPQAFAFVLSLIVFGICLRCAPPPRVLRSRAARWWASRLERLRGVIVRGTPVDEALPPAPLSSKSAIAVGGLCYLAVVVSHQLTPVILVAGVTALALVTRRVPLWVPAAMAAVEVWWLVLAWPYVSDHWSLFDPDPGASGNPAGYEVGEGLPGLALVAYAARAESVLMVALAAIGLVRRARAGYWDLPAASLIVAPLVVVGIQSYGGEGPYRLYLFALPWLALFAAAACAPARRALLANRKAGPRLAVTGPDGKPTGIGPRRVAANPDRTWAAMWEPIRRRGLSLRWRENTVLRQWRLALGTGVAGVCLLFAYFGLERMNHVSSEDVAAATWFERHAPRGSLLVQMTSNAVSRVTSSYASAYDTRYATSPILTDRDSYQHRRLGSEDLPRLEGKLRRYGVAHTFLILSGSQQRFARLYGILPPGWRPRLERVLYTSPSFSRVYGNGSSSIFEYRP